MPKHKKLKICYIAPDFDENACSGGLYVIFQHCNGLIARGHDVTIFNNTGKKSRYLKLDCPVEIHGNNSSIIERKLPDIIVGTSWRTYFFINQMEDILKNNVKLCFLIQSDDRFLYGEENKPFIYRVMTKRYKDIIPIHKIVISRYLQNLLKDEFDQDSFYIRNGFDPITAKPLLPQSHALRIVSRYDPSKFRGWDMVNDVLRKVSKEYSDIEIHLYEMKDKKSPGYNHHFHKGLHGEKLLGLFKSCDIYLSGSTYEGFGYPIMEAMSQGCAVCSTDAGGNREFCIDGQTALLSARDDAQCLYSNLVKLIDNKNLRERISAAGINKTIEFPWAESLGRLNEFFLLLGGEGCKEKVAILKTLPKNSRGNKRILFVYGKDPFVLYKDWINIEQTADYFMRCGHDITSFLFVDRHPLKFVKARLELLYSPGLQKMFKPNIFYSKKLRLRLPLFLSGFIFRVGLIIELVKADFVKDKKYGMLIAYDNDSLLLRILCKFLRIDFCRIDFNNGKLADFNFDSYQKEDMAREIEYRMFINEMLKNISSLL